MSGELRRRLSRLEQGQRERDWTDNCLSPTRSNGQNGVLHNTCFGIRDNWVQKLLSLTSCEPLNTFLNLSDSQYPHVKKTMETENEINKNIEWKLCCTSPE